MIACTAPALISPASQASRVASNSHCSFSPSATDDRDSPFDNPARASSQLEVEANPSHAATSPSRTSATVDTATASSCEDNACTSAVTASSSDSGNSSR